MIQYCILYMYSYTGYPCTDMPVQAPDPNLKNPA